MMNYNWKIDRKFIDQIIIFLSILLFNPFVIGNFISLKIIKHILVVLACLYFIYRSDLVISKEKFFIYLWIISLLIFYFIYYLNTDTKELNQTYDIFLRFVYILAITFYLFSGNHLHSIIKPFIKIVIVISILTIISCVSSNLHLLPFISTKIAGYKVGYNFFLGMVHWTFNSYFRPSLYFAEPSYLGFFIGFSFFFLTHISELNNRKLILFLVFISGVLTGSFTFYVAFIPTILIKNFNEKILFKLKRKLSIIYFIGFIFLSVNEISNLKNFNNSIFSNFQTSLSGRQFRMSLSIKTLKEESFGEILLGLGPGALLNQKRDLAESNAFLRMLIEEGLIITIFYLIIIYYYLRYNTELMIFCLLTFNSVVILDSPLLIMLLLVGSVSYRNISSLPSRIYSNMHLPTLNCSS